MKSTDKKQKASLRWHWSEPEGGLSLEECEQIARQIPRFTFLYNPLNKSAKS